LQFGDPEGAERQVREMVAAVGLGMMATDGSDIGGIQDRGILVFG
jgi:16S rRNA U516 pseudouridylate synthase RsuA-like enzyme